MNDNATEFSQLDSETISDPSALRLDSIVEHGAVLIIPVDAPVPSELADFPLPSGSLYSRLAPLDLDDTERDGFAFVPVSGAELMHLERCWRLLSNAKRVFVLFDMPGARYDVMFTQASRQIGLRRLEWPEVAEAFASKALSAQRTKDSSPWDAPTKPSEGGGRRVPKGLRVDDSPLEVPADEDSEGS